MAAPLIQLPAFPFVPVAPGIPALPRAPADINLPTLLAQAANGNVPPLLTSMLGGEVPSMLNGLSSTVLVGAAPYQSLLTQLTGTPILDANGTAVAPAASAPQWGIFDGNNTQVVIPDSVIQFEVTGESRIEKYPTEQGGFQSYNKVTVPYEIHLTMTKGGSIADRTAFIQALVAAKTSLNLYSVVTPEYTFLNANVVHNDIDRRADNGANLITATTWLEEVRITATATYTNTAQPSGANQANDGTVQATAPNAQQSTVSTDKFGAPVAS